MKLRNQLTPLLPVPMQPRVMRSEGAGRPAFPSAEAGMMAGKASAEEVLRNERRVVEADAAFMLSGIMGKRALAGNRFRHPPRSTAAARIRLGRLELEDRYPPISPGCPHGIPGDAQRVEPDPTGDRHPSGTTIA